MSDLETLIRSAVAAGTQVHVWPVHFGSGASASVRSRRGEHHVGREAADPITALHAALVEEARLRGAGDDNFAALLG